MNIRTLCTIIISSILVCCQVGFGASSEIGPITVSTSVELTQVLKTGGYKEARLAVLATGAGSSSGIMIRWKSDSDPFFPMWYVELAAPTGILPSQYIDGSEGGFDYINLIEPVFSVEPGIYNTVVAFDPTKGLLSFSIANETKKEQIRSGALSVAPYKGELYPLTSLIGPDGRSAKDEKAFKELSLVVDRKYASQGLLWQLQKEFFWDVVSVDNLEDRTRTEFHIDDALALYVDWPDAPIPGKARLSKVSQGQKVELATVEWGAEPTVTALPSTAEVLSYGAQKLIVEHIDGDAFYFVGEKDYMIALDRLHTELKAFGRNYNLPIEKMTKEIDPDPGIYGYFVIKAERDVSNVPITVKARFVPTTTVYDPFLTRLVKQNADAVDFERLEQNITLAAGETTEMPFSFSVPPGDGYMEFRLSTDDENTELIGTLYETRVFRTPMVPAFPGAEGFGAYTPGGRGGQVYVVTNLNDGGPGSLRSAIDAVGPRIVVFAVSGTIRLSSPLRIRNPYITIAGQTAPGDGITIADYPTEVLTNDVIIRHLRFRLGDLTGQTGGDALNIAEGENVIVDHVSASWSIDETLSIVGYDRITVQWSLITESLHESKHYKGVPHGYGSLIRGSFGARYNMHHNLWAHHNARQPMAGNYERYNVDPIGLYFDARNNVCYNWGGDNPSHNWDQYSISHWNFINNYYKAGPNSSPDSVLHHEHCMVCDAYFDGNAFNDVVLEDPWSKHVWVTERNEAYYRTEPFPMPYITTQSAHEAYESVLNYAGAFPRDPVDTRVIEGVRSGTGRSINSQEEVGGWPELKTDYSLAVDTNKNGIPDWWYKQYGLNSAEWLDPAGDLDSDGYTNIEEYLNGTNPLI